MEELINMVPQDDVCERCTKPASTLLAIEVKGTIKRWVCTDCYFKLMDTKKKWELIIKE